MSRLSLRLAFALVGVLVLTACAPAGITPPPPATPLLAMGTTTSTGDYPPATTVASTVASPAVITPRGTAGPPPAACDPEEVAQIVLDFLAAFNEGDQARLSGFFPQQGSDEAGVARDPANPNQFQWYTVTEAIASATATPHTVGRHFEVRNRADLLAYFARRHAQHERMQLRILGVGQLAGSGPDVVNVIYVLRREADDLPLGLGGADHIADGKAAVNCRRRQITVWSMGMNFIASGGEQAYLARVRPCPVPPAGTVTPPVVVCVRR